MSFSGNCLVPYMLFALIIIVNANTLNAQIKIKDRKYEHKILDNYGGSSFEENLKLFNSNTPNDKNNKYWGWNTNTNITSTGNPDAEKGGMITISGDDEYPSTLRGIGKDSRSQVLFILEAFQYESLLSYDYENTNKVAWKNLPQAGREQ